MKTTGIVLLILAALGIVMYVSRPGPGAETSPLPLHTKGNETARVELVEWSDFQCPACAAYYPILKGLLEKFPEDVKMTYRHFPLTRIHPNATAAGQAAEAAGLQGKFFEMHDMLFERQSEWSKAGNPVPLFVSYAEALGLNTETFSDDFSSADVRSAVTRDAAEGKKRNIRGTPTFFVNGARIENPTSAEAFEAIINEAITNAKKP